MAKAKTGESEEEEMNANERKFLEDNGMLLPSGEVREAPELTLAALLKENSEKLNFIEAGIRKLEDTLFGTSPCNDGVNEKMPACMREEVERQSKSLQEISKMLNEISNRLA